MVYVLLGDQTGSRLISLSIQSFVSLFKHLSRAKTICPEGVSFWQPCTNRCHTSFFYTISTSVIFLIRLSHMHTYFSLPVGLLLFEELCLLSNPSSRWVLIKSNWAELRWHWRGRRNSFVLFFFLTHWVTTALKDRRMDCRNRELA